MKILLSFLSLLLVFSTCLPQVDAQSIPDYEIDEDTTIQSNNEVQSQQLSPTPKYSPPVEYLENDDSDMWVIDQEVTYVGQKAARSGLIFDHVLRNFQWACSGDCAKNSSLFKLWFFTAISALILLVFVIIYKLNRYKSELKLEQRIRPFIGIGLILIFSYVLIGLVYQFADIIQSVFLSPVLGGSCPPSCITQKDLLYIGWDYREFVGYRILGDYKAEASAVSLMLTSLTTLTYDVMVFMLLLRKIVLWFFIVISPFIILFFFLTSVRGLAKIMSKEFLKWILYGPIFAVLLHGVAFIWKLQVPLNFAYFKPDGTGNDVVFPTAVNILLGSTSQIVTPVNNINHPETYLSYVFSLMMLWFVIIVPWLLLFLFFRHAKLGTLNPEKITIISKVVQYFK